MVRIKTIFILICLFIFSGTLLAQTSETSAGCSDPGIEQQVKELEEDLKEQGFEVMDEAMFSLGSRTEHPLYYKLQKSEFYQIIFVCNEDANKMKLELIDPQQDVLMSKELRPIQHSSNVISFSFAPESDDSYTFLLSQISKKKSCVSFTIMRLKSEAEREE